MRPGDVVAGRFELASLAGAGGMGEVWCALDRTSGVRVALKLVLGHRPSGAARFAREAQVLAELNHPGIVRYVAHGFADSGAPYLAMEWLEGENLRARLQREPLTVSEAIEVARRIAEALGAAHARGVVHRDVNPANVFLVGGRLEGVRLLDFGIARQQGGESDPTVTGVAIGTAGYMAPEQVLGERTLDARADVFALGCLLFECVSGRPTFDAEQGVAVLMKVLLEEPPRLGERMAGVPQELDALLGRMLAKRAALRPADGAALARELSLVGFQVASTVARTSTSNRAPSLTRSEQRLMTIVLAQRARAPSSRALASDAPTATVEALGMPLLEQMRTSVLPYGARVECLADGSIIGVISGTGAVTDRAARAARCALAMRSALADATIAMATGHGDEAGRFPVGEVVDRVARLVRSARAGAGVRVDEITAGALDIRFQVANDEDGLVLVREREHVATSRMLLGRPAPYVGRDRETTSVVAMYEECVAEPVARALLVTGPAGIGKSRLASEALRVFATCARPPVVWMGRGDETAQGSPFGLLRPSIRDAAGIKQDEPLPIQRQKLRARVDLTVRSEDRERVTVFLGELLGLKVPDEGDVVLRAARRDPMIMGDQIRTAWQEFLHGQTEGGPLVILLEDLHWGDLPTVRLLDLALHNQRDRPWMVLATARPEVHAVFPALWTERGLDALALGGLSPRASQGLVSAVLGERVTPDRAARMASLSDGNPLALEEFVRAAAAGRTDDVPATVTAMAEARLAELEEGARRVVRAASVFGRVFWAGGVAALLGDSRDAGQWLDVLEEREVIAYAGEGRFGGDREYAFLHAVAAQAAYAMLTDTDRVLGHRLAAEWLERSGERDAVVVAHHFERGQALPRASAWWLRAAKEALDGNDLGAAIAHADRVVACKADGEAAALARLVQANAHSWRDESEQMLARAEEARAGLPPRTDAWWDALAHAIGAAFRLGRRDALVRLIEPIEEHLALAVVPSPVLAVAARAARCLLSVGEPDAGHRLLAAIAAIDSSGVTVSSDTRAWISRARADAALLEGNPGDYLTANMEALREHELAGDLRSACARRGSTAHGYALVGEYDKAAEALREVLSEADRMGLPVLRSSALHSLGFALLRLGRASEAESVERQAIDAYVRLGNRRMEGGSRIYLAQILIARGDLRVAEVEAARAIELLEAVPAARPYALASLARVHLARADPAAALASARSAMEGLQQGAIEEGEAEIRLVLAESLHGTTDRSAAQEAIRTARDRVLERASRITRTDHRESFLGRVPEHARTIALARAWLDEPGSRGV